MRSGPKYNSVQGLIDFREKSTPNQITPEDSNSDVCLQYTGAREFSFSDGDNLNLSTSFDALINARIKRHEVQDRQNSRHGGRACVYK